MKFLFKITLLILICMSNALFGLKSSNPLLEKIDINDEQMEQKLAMFIFTPEETEQLKQIIKAEKRINKILNSDDCNCAKLKQLNTYELNMIQFRLLYQYSTPKSEKRIQKEAEDFVKFFHNFLLDQKVEKEEVEALLEQRIENMKKVNEEMKCIQKILTTINELRNQNKAE